MKKTKILTLANQKGGVGKTTFAITLAVGLACRGKKILLIDLDSQASAGRGFRIPDSPGVMNLLVNDVTIPAIQAMIRSMLRKPKPRVEGEPPAWVENIDVLPGDKSTTIASENVRGSDHLPQLRERISAVFGESGYDFIILDTPPSIGGVQEPAIWAADYLLIPMTPEQGAYDGLSKILRDADAMAKLPDYLRWTGSLLGVVLNEFETKARLSNDMFALLQKHFGKLALGPVHRTTYFPQASGAGLTIYEWDPSGRAVREYEEIVDIVLRAR